MDSYPIFLPRVRYIPLEDVMFLYRWCMTDEQILDLWWQKQLIEVRGLNCSVTFKQDPQRHRRLDFACLAGQTGWLRVALGFVPNDSSHVYLLYSASTHYGAPLEFYQLNAYFDFTVFSGALDAIPERIEDKLSREINYHVEVCLDHQNQKLTANDTTRNQEQDSFFSELDAETEHHLKEIRRKLRPAGTDEERRFLREHRHQLGEALLTVDPLERSAVDNISAEREQCPIQVVDLFTMNWKIKTG